LFKKFGPCEKTLLPAGVPTWLRACSSLSLFGSGRSSILPATKDQSWQWGVKEERSFNDVKQLLAAPGLATLPFSHTNARPADSSSFGLGGVLLQNFEGIFYPVGYASWPC